MNITTYVVEVTKRATAQQFAHTFTDEDCSSFDSPEAYFDSIHKLFFAPDTTWMIVDEVETEVAEPAVRKFYVLTNGTEAVNRGWFTAEQFAEAKARTDGNWIWVLDTVQDINRPSFAEVSPITPVVKLLVEHGSLCTPFSAIVDEANREHFRQCGLSDPFKPEAERGPSNPVLLVEHDGGDHDTIAWPLTQRGHLASALYGARETGLIPDVTEVTLPDGSTFNIDMEVR